MTLLTIRIINHKTKVTDLLLTGITIDSPAYFNYSEPKVEFRQCQHLHTDKWGWSSAFLSCKGDRYRILDL